MPKSAMMEIRLPSQTLPPRGEIASPKTVVINDPDRKVGRELKLSTNFRHAVPNFILGSLAFDSADRTI
jgi:hypothetical protein